MTPEPKLRLHLFQPSVVARLWSLLGRASMGVYRDGGLSVAKGVAYSSLLAFFPVLTTLAAILAQAQAESVSRTIARLLYDVVPPGTDDVVKTLFAVHGQRPKWLLIPAIVLAAWSRLERHHQPDEASARCIEPRTPALSCVSASLAMLLVVICSAAGVGRVGVDRFRRARRA